MGTLVFGDRTRKGAHDVPSNWPWTDIRHTDKLPFPSLSCSLLKSLPFTAEPPAQGSVQWDQGVLTATSPLCPATRQNRKVSLNASSLNAEPPFLPLGHTYLFPGPHLDVGHPVGESGSPPLVLLTLAWKKLCFLFQGQGEVHSYWTFCP